VKANVLFFDRKPASATPWTKTLWIYDFRTNEHFTLKTNPLKRADLDDFVSCYNAENRHERKETERFRSFSYEDLLKRDKVSLDIFWLKDEGLEDSANLPDPDVIARRNCRGSAGGTRPVHPDRRRFEKIRHNLEHSPPSAIPGKY
jgi:type I restriction enzyme M protein